MTAKENIEGFIIVIPFALTMFPIPLLFPIALVSMVLDQPEEWPLLAIYFLWLAVAIVLAIKHDRKLKLKQ